MGTDYTSGNRVPGLCVALSATHAFGNDSLIRPVFLIEGLTSQSVVAFDDNAAAREDARFDGPPPASAPRAGCSGTENSSGCGCLAHKGRK